MPLMKGLLAQDPPPMGVERVPFRGAGAVSERTAATPDRGAFAREAMQRCRRQLRHAREATRAQLVQYADPGGDLIIAPAGARSPSPPAAALSVRPAAGGDIHGTRGRVAPARDRRASLGGPARRPGPAEAHGAAPMRPHLGTGARARPPGESAGPPKFKSTAALPPSNGPARPLYFPRCVIGGDWAPAARYSVCCCGRGEDCAETYISAGNLRNHVPESAICPTDHRHFQGQPRLDSDGFVRCSDFGCWSSWSPIP